MLQYLTRGMYKSVRHGLMILLSDSLYNSDTVERVLKDAFGAHKGMLDPKHSVDCADVAVVVDNATTSTCEILPSYNKTGHVKESSYSWPACDSEYTNRVKVWDA